MALGQSWVNQELGQGTHRSLLANPSSKDDTVAVSRIVPLKMEMTPISPRRASFHEFITQAKAEDCPQGLSRTNLIAVRKRWQEQHSEIITDAATTLENEASSPDGDDDDDDFDYGWDDSELGFTMPGKLSPEQVGLAKPVRIRAFTVRISHT